MRSKKWISVTAEWNAMIGWLLEYKHAYILNKIFHLYFLYDAESLDILYF